MKVAVGDIWEYLGQRLIVIPTNCGWKRDGSNVMGRGLAKQASTRYGDLASWYGAFCRGHGKGTPVVQHPTLPLILFPVKPLNESDPAMSWKSGASPSLIERSARQLAQMEGDIALPLVGCGNGGLHWEQVVPILKPILIGDRFLLVVPQPRERT